MAVLKIKAAVFHLKNRNMEGVLNAPFFPKYGGSLGGFRHAIFCTIPVTPRAVM